MAISRDKYQQAILFFVEQCGNQHLGRTKLMKLLYYLDFDHLERYRRTVTGDTYLRLEHGPVPEHSWEMIEEMDGSLLSVQRVPLPGDRTQHQFVALCAPDLTVFTGEELGTLRSVVERWRGATRAEIVDASHVELPWLATGMRQRVPLHLAFHRLPKEPLTERDREMAIESMMSSYALEGIDIPQDVAARAFDEVYAGRMPALSKTR